MCKEAGEKEEEWRGEEREGVGLTEALLVMEGGREGER